MYHHLSTPVGNYMACRSRKEHIPRKFKEATGKGSKGLDCDYMHAGSSSVNNIILGRHTEMSLVPMPRPHSQEAFLDQFYSVDTSKRALENNVVPHRNVQQSLAVPREPLPIIQPTPIRPLHIDVELLTGGYSRKTPMRYIECPLTPCSNMPNAQSSPISEGLHASALDIAAPTPDTSTGENPPANPANSTIAPIGPLLNHDFVSSARFERASQPAQVPEETMAPVDEESLLAQDIRKLQDTQSEVPSPQKHLSIAIKSTLATKEQPETVNLTAQAKETHKPNGATHNGSDKKSSAGKLTSGKKPSRSDRTAKSKKLTESSLKKLDRTTRLSAPPAPKDWTADIPTRAVRKPRNMTPIPKPPKQSILYTQGASKTINVNVLMKQRAAQAAQADQTAEVAKAIEVTKSIKAAEVARAVQTPKKNQQTLQMTTNQRQSAKAVETPKTIQYTSQIANSQRRAARAVEIPKYTSQIATDQRQAAAKKHEEDQGQRDRVAAIKAAIHADEQRQREEDEAQCTVKACDQCKGRYPGKCKMCSHLSRLDREVRDAGWFVYREEWIPGKGRPLRYVFPLNVGEAAIAPLPEDVPEDYDEPEEDCNEPKSLAATSSPISIILEHRLEAPRSPSHQEGNSPKITPETTPVKLLATRPFYETNDASREAQEPTLDPASDHAMKSEPPLINGITHPSQAAVNIWEERDDYIIDRKGRDFRHWRKAIYIENRWYYTYYDDDGPMIKQDHLMGPGRGEGMSAAEKSQYLDESPFIRFTNAQGLPTLPRPVDDFPRIVDTYDAYEAVQAEDETNIHLSWDCMDDYHLNQPFPVGTEEDNDDMGVDRPTSERHEGDYSDLDFDDPPKLLGASNFVLDHVGKPDQIAQVQNTSNHTNASQSGNCSGEAISAVVAVSATSHSDPVVSTAEPITEARPVSVTQSHPFILPPPPLDVQKPLLSQHQSQPTVCFNCWSSAHGHSRNCPDKFLSISKKERLRVRLNASITPVWEKILAKHWGELELCWNCWMGKHLRDKCPAPPRSCKEREHVRRVKGVEATSGWLAHMKREGYTPPCDTVYEDNDGLRFTIGSRGEKVHLEDVLVCFFCGGNHLGIDCSSSAARRAIRLFEEPVIVPVVENTLKCWECSGLHDAADCPTIGKPSVPEMAETSCFTDGHILYPISDYGYSDDNLSSTGSCASFSVCSDENDEGFRVILKHGSTTNSKVFEKFSNKGVGVELNRGFVHQVKNKNLPPPICKLPTEILDRILGFVAGDRLSELVLPEDSIADQTIENGAKYVNAMALELHASHIVNHWFGAVTQRVLYRDIYIYDFGRLNKFLRTVTSDPIIASYVKKFSIDFIHIFRAWNGPQGASLPGLDKKCLSHEVLVHKMRTLLDSLPNVETFSLNLNGATGLLNVADGHYPYLKRLHLNEYDNVGMHNQHTWRNLQRFPRLEELKVYHTLKNDEADFDLLRIPASVDMKFSTYIHRSLRALNFSRSPEVDDEKLLRLVPQLPFLETLKLEECKLVTASGLATVLEAVPKNQMRHLGYKAWRSINAGTTIIEQAPQEKHLCMTIRGQCRESLQGLHYEPYRICDAIFADGAEWPELTKVEIKADEWYCCADPGDRTASCVRDAYMACTFPKLQHQTVIKIGGRGFSWGLYPQADHGYRDEDDIGCCPPDNNEASQ